MAPTGKETMTLTNRDIYTKARIIMGLNATKPVFGAPDKVIFKSVSSATETS